VLLPAAILAFFPLISRPPAFAAEEAPTLPAPTPAAPAPEAAPARRLTLEEAKQLALSNNKALALARLNVNEKHYAKAAAWKDYLPKFIANETYFHFNDNLGTVVTVPRGSLGILPIGGATIAANVLNQDTSLTTLFVAQPITKLIAVNAAVQIARADENAAKAQLDKGTRDLLSGVAQAYYGLLGAKRIQTTVELQIKLLEQVMEVKPLPEARIGLVEARQGLLQVRGQVEELTQQFNDLLGLPACTVLELVDPIPAELPVRCADNAVQLALAHNPEVREAEQTIAKARAALQVARADYLPDINMIGGYANQTGASYIQPNISYLGLVGTWTMFEWGKRRDISRQRKTQIALAQQNLQVTIDKVQLNARKTYSAFEQAREGYKLAGEMVEARKEAEKKATGLAVVQAKAETSRAELEQMKAEIAYRVAHAQLAAILCME
jgi:outer membrane protein TolC